MVGQVSFNAIDINIDLRHFLSEPYEFILTKRVRTKSAPCASSNDRSTEGGFEFERAARTTRFCLLVSGMR
jgi:hypothetical protein